MSMDNQPLLVFAHLRKTAGTTVSYVMWRQFRRGEVINLNAPTIEAANEKWNALAPDRRSSVKCIRGHLPYSPDLFAPRKTICFTMLRDPVERVVSEYYFNLRNAGEKFHVALTHERLTLDQFVKSEISAEVHNTQTRMLAGAPVGSSAGELLELAWTNLREHLTMVGISERLDESLLLCRAILGWRHVLYRPVNVNPWRPAIETIPAETLSAIERANSLDRQLYRLGCARFDELLGEQHIRPPEVRALRRMSKAYGAVRRAIGLPREIWIEAQLALARRRVASSLKSQPPRSSY